MRHRGTIPLVVVLATLFLSACPATTPSRVLGVTIDQDLTYLVLGETRQLTATVPTTGGADASVTWTSTNPAVAIVDAAGLVGAIATGATTVTATSVVDPTRSDDLALEVVAAGEAFWTHQFGTSTIDQAFGGTLAPGGRSVAVGTTYGDLDGVNAGGPDAFVRMVDADGQAVWTRQFGTAVDDMALAVAVAADGTVAVVGWTLSDLFGTSAGNRDAFVATFGPDGTPDWALQFGSSGADEADGVAIAPDGTIFVVGRAGGALDGVAFGDLDAFLRAFDADGDPLWTRQIGTAQEDAAYDVAVDAAGRPVVVGTTRGDLAETHLGDLDAFAWAVTADGATRWVHHFGTAELDVAASVAIDPGGDVLVAGWTSGGLFGPGGGSTDAFVRRLTSDGDPAWTRQYGTATADYANAVAVDGHGDVVVAGSTYGDLAGSAGSVDGYVRTFAANGDVRSTHQFGTASGEFVTDLATDGEDSRFTFGQTPGALGDATYGTIDGYVRKAAR